jgi:hypothetical protein
MKSSLLFKVSIQHMYLWFYVCNACMEVSLLLSTAMCTRNWINKSQKYIALIVLKIYLWINFKMK